MGELALHILDIVQNSISAKADLIKIIISIKDGFLIIEIIDNGCGMDENELESVLSPFSTSRKTRKVGLGIPMFKESCERCNGEFILSSTKNKGTRVFASFELDNIDRPPLGNIAETMMTLITCNVDCDFEFKFMEKGQEYELQTKQIKRVLNGVPINNFEVAQYIEDSIKEGIESVYKEGTL